MSLPDSLRETAWQDLLTTIIEDADSNVLLLDEDFRIINLNPGFYWIFLETYGIELKRGSSLVQVMHIVNPELSRMWLRHCEAALERNSIKVEETFEIDERIYFWEINFKAIKNTPDGTTLISIFSRDVTVRKAFQKKIIENEANVRSILDTMEDSLWLVNARLELIDFNEGFAKKYRENYGIELVRGVSILESLPEELPGLRQQWHERYESSLNGTPGKFIDTFSYNNADWVFEIKTFPIMDNGFVRGVTVYARDITNQVRAENLLKEQNEELTKINSELDRFVYSASHDLRAPLMSIKGLLNMIRVDPDKENRAFYLQLIEQSVSKLDSFILDIVNYSRNSRMELIPKEIDFTTLLQESIESLRYMEGAERVRTIIDIKKGVAFYSDYSRLLIVFNNIISNAMRYCDRYKEDSYLEINIETHDAKALINFSDNGVGIDEQYLENIFKMFFRANADSKGSGLGLYIVKGVIDKLEGTIEVKSKLGLGTTFAIVVPNLKERD